MNRLPVFRSVGEVFSGVTRHYFELIGIAIVPLALSFGILVGLAIWMPDSEVARWALISELPRPDGAAGAPTLEDDKTNTIIAICAVALSYLCFVPAAVSWHRFVLFGERGGRSLLRRVNMRYLIVFFKLIVGWIMVSIPVGIAAFAAGGLSGELLIVVNLVERGDDAAGKISIVIGALTATLLGFMVTMRFSLSLPDAVAGGRGSIEDMIDRTKGNSWRLVWLNVWIVAGMTVIVLIYSFLTVQAVAALFSLTAIPMTVLAMIVEMPLTAYSSMIAVTMLSVAYREIIGLPDSGEPEESPSDMTPISA